LCFLRLAQLIGETTTWWVETADTIFGDMKGGWDANANACGGGVWWKRDPRDFTDNEKGSIENELYMDVAMTLYRLNTSATADRRKEYLEETEKTWQWLSKWLVTSNWTDTPNNLMWGSLEAGCKPKATNPARPYNQGVVLGPLWELFKVKN